MRSRAVAGMVLGYWGCASTILSCGAICVSVVVGVEGGEGRLKKLRGRRKYSS